MVNKKAFSFVEIIIAVSIIALLTLIWFSYMNSSKDKTDNAKVVSDIATLNNALLSYSQDNGKLPMPGWNENFFKVNTDYAHSYSWSETFWVYGSVTKNTIPKKYLDILPLDPRTNSYYSYGKTKESNEFEIAWVQKIDSEYKASVSWDYTAENWPYNLIREYNGADFVNNDSKTNLPYNPEELVLIATDSKWNVFREWDKIRTDTTSVYKNNVVLYNTTNDLELFFSDGSVSILKQGSEITLNKLNFPKNNNLTTFIQIALKTGTIWTRATHLNDDSEFQVSTTDSTAAVRWTIFWVSYDTTNWTDVVVIKWKVDVIKNTLDADWNEILIKELNAWDSVKTKNQQIRAWTTPAIQTTDYENTIKTKFILNKAIRDNTKIESIRSQNNKKKQDNQKKISKYSCMLNGQEVAESNESHPTWKYMYKEKISANCNSDSNRQEVQCVKWNILVNSAYRYDSCNAPWNCWAYNKDNFTANNITPWSSATVTKTIDYKDTTSWVKMWEYTSKRTIKCKSDGSWYDQIGSDINSSLTCDAPDYVIDNNTWYCKAVAVTCSIWNLTWWTENADWKCVVDLSIPTSSFGSNINIDTTDYEILINWNPITLNHISKVFKIKWKEYSDWKRYTIFHVTPNYSSEDYPLNTFSSFQIREKDDWSETWAGWVTVSWNWCNCNWQWYYETPWNRDWEHCWYTWLWWEQNERYCNNIKWSDWLDVVCAREKDHSWRPAKCDWFENKSWIWTIY